MLGIQWDFGVVQAKMIGMFVLNLQENWKKE